MATHMTEIAVAVPEPREHREMPAPAADKKADARLISLDAYRGFIMLLLASSGFGLAMLAGSWALFALFPGPQGAFSQTGNIGAVLDLKLLGYNYSGYYTTINFIGNAVTILFGCWAGMLLRTGKTHAGKLKILIACAA